MVNLNTSETDRLGTSVTPELSFLMLPKQVRSLGSVIWIAGRRQTQNKGLQACRPNLQEAE